MYDHVHKYQNLPYEFYELQHYRCALKLENKYEKIHPMMKHNQGSVTLNCIVSQKPTHTQRRKREKKNKFRTLHENECLIRGN
jgi:hypothetical protein